MATGKWGIADQARTKAAFLTDEEGNPVAIQSAIVSATVVAVSATVNVAAGLVSIDNIPTVNVGNTVIITGTVNTVGGSGLATVNVAGGNVNANVWDDTVAQRAHVRNADVDAVDPAANYGLTTNARLYGFNGTTLDRLRSTIANGLAVDVTRSAAVAVSSLPTINVGNTVNVLGTATVNLGSIGTINIGNTVAIASLPTVNVGNTVNVLGTATVNLGSIGTINIGNTHPVTVTGNVSATVVQGTIPTVNLGTIPTVNLGLVITATANLGSIPTVNLGAAITATVNLGSSIPSGSNPIGQTYGRASTTNPTAVADGAAVRAMLDSLGRTIIGDAPPELLEANSILLASSINTQVFAGFTTLKHYIGTIAAAMTFSIAGPSTLTIRNGGVGGTAIYAYTFTGANQNMPPVTFSPVYSLMTASFQVTADITASTAGVRVSVTGFRGP